MRSGTLNVPGIVGLGAACEIAQKEMPEESVRLGKLRDRLRAGLEAKLDEVFINGSMTVQDFFRRAPHTELNPDEVVALGAAVQANILDRGVSNMLLLDVTPLSLGIETYGGAVAKIIPRNSTIPASAQELYTTGVDHQTGIDIHVLQGERELAKDCRSLARFTLKTPPAPAGLPRIEVKFLIDANGILQVGAKDVRTGEQHSVEVQPSYGISEREIERMEILRLLGKVRRR